jgi:hypothetical protein
MPYSKHAVERSFTNERSGWQNQNEKFNEKQDTIESYESFESLKSYANKIVVKKKKENETTENI